MYAYDTALFFAARNIQTIQTALQEDLNAVGEWFSLNRLLVNCDKTTVMVFGAKKHRKITRTLFIFIGQTFGVV